jgi:NADPH:quinone reductase-like Zn-dependent oxidoreductase
MKATIFENPGLENLKVVDNVKEPQFTDRDVLMKVKVADVNPLDKFCCFRCTSKINSATKSSS